MVGPDSSYSPVETHISWNVLSDDRMNPPIQTQYLRALTSPCEHGGATREDDITIQILSYIDVTLHDRLGRCVMEAARLFSDERRLEKNLRGAALR